MLGIRFDEFGSADRKVQGRRAARLKSQPRFEPGSGHRSTGPLPASRLMSLCRGLSHRRRGSLPTSPRATRSGVAGPGRYLPAAHGASTAKRSPKTNENSLRALCQKAGGLRHLLSTPRSAT